ncbi:hypothetical protein HNQ56_000619 [Anaerotaenia torta]
MIIDMLIIVILLFGVYDVRLKNQKIRNGYLNGEYLYRFISSVNKDHPYEQRNNLQDADLMGEYLSDRSYLIIYMPGSKEVEFTLKHTLNYYSKPSILSKKILSIPAGSICYDDYKTSNTKKSIYEIYGFRSWPTYHKGWRLVIPFATKETLEEYKKNEIGIPYYIRTNDLYQSFYDYISGENKAAYYSRFVYSESMDVDKKAMYWDFYEKDKMLYQKGYFLSPDFYQSFWNRGYIVLISVMFVLSVLLMLPIYKKIKKKAIKQGVLLRC